MRKVFVGSRRARIASAGTLGVLLLALGLAWFAVAQPLFTTPEPRVTPSVDPRRLEAHVRVLAQLIPRDWAHPENLDQVAAYVRRELEAANGRSREQRYEMDGKTYRNVVATFGPDSPDVVIVGAHYDAFGDFPAADDNASGVAGLLELAHLLSTDRLQSRVELLAFTLEEPTTKEGRGLFRSRFGGSAVHARSLVQQDAKVRIMLNLEMIGYFSDEEDSQRYPLGLLRLFYPSRGNFITVVGKFGQGRAVRRVKAALRSASPLPVYSLTAPAVVEGVDWSDHANYWNAGYDAVMVTDTGLYRNPNYHTRRDTPDTLDYVRMAQVVGGVWAAVQAFATQE